MPWVKRLGLRVHHAHCYCHWVVLPTTQGLCLNFLVPRALIAYEHLARVLQQKMSACIPCMDVLTYHVNLEPTAGLPKLPLIVGPCKICGLSGCFQVAGLSFPRSSIPQTPPYEVTSKILGCITAGTPLPNPR